MLKLAEKIAKEYLHRDDVTGVFVGHKRKGSKIVDDICVSIHVKRKLPPGQVPPGNMIPKEIAGLPSDVLQCTFKAAGSPYDRFDIVRGGIAIGPDDLPATTGTAGLVCYDASDFYNPGILTCAHVAVVKSDYTRHILQPSRNEAGSIPAADKVGTLTRYLVDSRNDSAIIKLSRGYAFELFPTDTIITSTAIAEVDDFVEKCGCASGMTIETVDSVGQTALDLGSVHGNVTISGFVAASWGYEFPIAGDSGAIYYAPETGIGKGMICGIDVDGLDSAFACHLPYVISDMNLLLSYSATTTSYWSEVIPEKQSIWAAIGDEMVTSFTISPQRDLYHVYLFTTSGFADGINGVMWGKRSTDAEYMLIGPHSMSPTCFIGDVLAGQSVTIDLKLLPTSMLSLLTEYEIPVYVGHGTTLIGGYA